MKLLKNDDIELEAGKKVFVFSEGCKNFMEIGHGNQVTIHQVIEENEVEPGVYQLEGLELKRIK